MNNPATDSYKISLCYNNEIKHYKIKTNSYKSAATIGSTDENSVRYCFEGGLEFESITQLVDYYHRCADGLAFTLRTPFIPASRLDPALLNFLSTNNTNSPLVSSRKTPQRPPLLAAASANPHSGVTPSPTNGLTNKKVFNNMLNNDGIYDSNRMYEVILSNSNNKSDHVHADSNGNFFISNISSLMKWKREKNKGRRVTNTFS